MSFYSMALLFLLSAVSAGSPQAARLRPQSEITPFAASSANVHERPESSQQSATRALGFGLRERSCISPKKHFGMTAALFAGVPTRLGSSLAIAPSDFYFPTHTVRNALRWTSDLVASEPQLPASGDELPMLTRVRTALYVLFETGSKECYYLDQRLSLLLDECDYAETALGNENHRTSLVRACAAALPAALQRDPSAMAVANVLLREIVTTLDKLFADLPASSMPTALADGTGVAVVRKWIAQVYLAPDPARTGTKLSILVAAALMLRHGTGAEFDARACERLTNALRHVPRLAMLRHSRAFTVNMNVHVEMARHFMAINGAIGGVVRAQRGKLETRVARQLALLQGVHDDLGEHLYEWRFSRNDGALDGLADRLLAHCDVPVTLRPFVLALVRDEVEERRQHCALLVERWMQTRSKVKAVRYLRALIEIASQLLVQGFVDQHGGAAVDVRMDEGDMPLEPEPSVWSCLLSCLMSMIVVAPAVNNFEFVIFQLVRACPSIDVRTPSALGR